MDAPTGGDHAQARALLSALLALPTDVVHQALGLPTAADPIGDPAVAALVAHPAQDLADAVADGLAQLGWVIRRNPWLAPELRWELAGLAPTMVLSPPARDAVTATAAAVGAGIGPARYDSRGRDVATTVVELGRGTVRLLLTVEQPAISPADMTP